MTKKPVKRRDPLNPRQRSIQMARVRATRNRSTEMHVAARLIRQKVRGWKRHASEVPGRPDFWFVRERVAVFVDGCFWHGCPQCRRNVPSSRRAFWKQKIAANRRRDQRVKRLLRGQGCAIFRVWEHELSNPRWLDRLRAILQRYSQG